MKLPYRKPITISSSEHISFLLSRPFGESINIEAHVGPGWNDIIYDLHKKLEAEKPDYHVFQIKEKFGSLRFYVGEMTYPGWDFISEAETASLRTCEECGRPGKIWNWNRGGWVRTLCWIDYMVSEVNKNLWLLQRKGLGAFFKTYFYVRRLRRNMKRKESAEK